jgi:hypothetical protein
MKILILYVEPTIWYMLQQVLELEEYADIRTRNSSEAVRDIEESTDSYLLLTDNLHVNPEVREALAVLRDNSDLRQRLWVVNLAVWSESAWITDGLIDEHLAMPFTVDQVLSIVEAHATPPT